MKPGVPPKPAGAKQRDSGAEGAGTLVFGGAPLLRPGESGSGVRKIAEAKRAAEQSEPSSDDEQIGPYRLLERIGEGAMGYVYRAEHTLIGRVVAVKALREELTDREACVQRFLAEARAVNLIKHPHIIDVTDFACTPEGRPWFVMELLEGSDLLQEAAREPLSLRRTLEIVRQLCEALAAVHAAGVIHRDVKPENIFLRQRDGRDFVTLLDFGIARLPDPVNADPLQEGLMGTSYYMAPEQASASVIDYRADLYAVGSTLFELIVGAGRTPFRAKNIQHQLLQVLMAAPPRLSDRAFVPVIVRKELDGLVERLLAKDPNDRPSSASEVAGELAAIAEKLEGRSSEAPSAIEPPMLLASDALEAPPTPIAGRTRARRAAYSESDESAFWAIMLSALVALAAVWFATREADWAHVIKRALGGDGGAAKHIEHTIAPVTTAPGTPAPLVVEPPSAPPAGVGAGDDDDRKREARKDRRGVRVKPRPSRKVEARPEPEVAREEPVLRIEPAADPEPELPAARDDLALDRDMVLHPFER